MLMAQLERDDWLGFAYAVEAPPAIDLGAIAEPAFGGTEHALAVSFFKKMMPPRKVRAGGKEKSARRETKKSAQMTSSVKRMSGIKLQETTSGGKDTSSSAGEDGEDAPHGGKKSGKATASKKSGKQGTSSENKDTATSSAEEDEEQAPRAGKKSAKATSSKKGGGRANKQAAALPPGLLGKAEEALQAIGFTRRQAAVLGQKIAGTAEDALGSDAFLLTEDEKRVATDGLSGATIHDLEDLVAELVHQKADFFKEYLENADGNITSGQDKSAEPLSLLADTVLDPNKKTKGKPKKRAGAAAKK
ncbi:unnamed protein product [Amoebophrya sp. A120]|nr:unnamed protein product [Amoebophrya sp. A120]|eukprot:GSA120T00003282001.1